jgi:hypothetical protein
MKNLLQKMPAKELTNCGFIAIFAPLCGINNAKLLIFVPFGTFLAVLCSFFCKKCKAGI